MKKKIPLIILEFIQPIVEKNATIIHQVKNENMLFSLLDNDSTSDFFFRLVKQETRNGRMHYLTEFKPLSRENVNTHGEWIQLDQVNARLSIWIEMITTYNNLKTIYDDPILKHYEESFLSEIDLTDEDADIAPFDLKKQLYLEEYLSSVDGKLEKLKYSKTNEEVNELSELQKEAQDIKKELSKLTKRKLVRRLAKFWAKSQKVGLDVIREIFINVTVEIAKRFLTDSN